MILVSDIVEICQSRTDASDSQYYLFNEDWKPAIQSAQRWLVQVIDSAYAQKKVSEEIFRELSYVTVFQASNFSRIRITDFVWTFFSIEPNPITFPAFTPQVLPNPQDSIERIELSHISALNTASRKTIEEWNEGATNPFADGHLLEAGETNIAYAYLSFFNYQSTNYSLSPPTRATEIEIRPSIANLPCTIRYARVPQPPNFITDTLEFPMMFTELIVAKTLSYISVKQGDMSTLEKISDKDISILLSSMR